MAATTAAIKEHAPRLDAALAARTAPPAPPATAKGAAAGDARGHHHASPQRHGHHHQHQQHNQQHGGTHDPICAERFKTRLCKNFELHGHCPYVYRCMFAHGPQELRTTAMNLADGLTTEHAILAFKRHAYKAEKRERNRAAKVAQQQSATAAAKTDDAASDASDMEGNEEPAEAADTPPVAPLKRFAAVAAAVALPTSAFVPSDAGRRSPGAAVGGTSPSVASSAAVDGGSDAPLTVGSGEDALAALAGDNERSISIVMAGGATAASPATPPPASAAWRHDPYAQWSVWHPLAPAPLPSWQRWDGSRGRWSSPPYEGDGAASPRAFYAPRSHHATPNRPSSRPFAASLPGSPPPPPSWW